MRTADSEILTRLQKYLIGSCYTSEQMQDMGDDTICAFGDAECNGETEVILSDNEYISDDEYKFQAYINNVDASIFLIYVKIENSKHKIVDVTLA